MERDRGPDQGHTHLSQLDRARERVRQILSASTYAHPICLRCGGKGHFATECCNPIVCFACDKTSHRSRKCRDIAQPLKPLQELDFDNHHHKVLSFTVNVHIGRDGECQKSHNSQWIWKRKDNQEQKNSIQMKEEIRGEQQNMNEGYIAEEKKINVEMTKLEVIPLRESLHRMEKSTTEVRIEGFQPHLEVVSHKTNITGGVGQKETPISPRKIRAIESTQSSKEELSDSVKSTGDGTSSMITCAQQMMHTPLPKEVQMTHTPLTTIDIVQPTLTIEKSSERQKENEGEEGEFKEEIKVKKESKKKKKGENKKKWIITRDEQKQIVVHLM